MGDLFRHEVLEAQRGQWLGTINLATPLAFGWWTVLSALLAVAVAAFLVFGHYTSHATVGGQLIPSTGLLALSAQSAGTVSRVLVHEGESVRAGQPLVEVSADVVSARMGDTHAVVSRVLRAEEARVRTTLANLKPQSASKAADLSKRIAILEAGIKQIDGQLVLQRAQAGTAANLLQAVRPLHERGIVATVEFDQYKVNALTAQSQVKALSRQRLDAESQLSSLHAQAQQLPLDTAASATQLRSQLASLDTQLATNEAERSAVLRAPSAGVVSALLVHPGQHVEAGRSVISVLPHTSTLQAQLLVSSNDIGFVTVGSRVALRYQAFPYQKYGQQFGTVVLISRSALSPAEAAFLTGQQVMTPTYRVLVSLDRQSIAADGKARALRAGMGLTADILLDRRSLWQWAFAPLAGLHQKLAVSGTARG